MFPLAVIIWLLTVLFDKKLIILHKFSSFWASIYTWLNPLWKVRIENWHKLVRHKVYIIVTNHQSLLDILVLYRLFAHFKWVSKIENFHIPIVGWNMRLNRYIEINRGKTKSFLKMMRDCENNLLSGSSILIFPEGTRSEDGKLGTFKQGAFKLAIKTNIPILPIVLDGTAKALPKNGFILRNRSNIKVKVLNEISPESFASMSSQELTKIVRSVMENELKKMNPIHTGS